MSDVRAPVWRSEAPGIPRAFQGVTSLGSFVRVYSQKEKGVRASTVFLVFAGVMLVVVAIVLVYGQPFAAIGPALVAVIVGLSGLLDVISLRNAASSVALFSDGFAAISRSQVSVWAWSDILSIVTDVRLRASKRTVWRVHRYDVSKRSGETIVLHSDRLDDVVKLVDVVKGNVYSLLEPPAQKEWDAGATLRFGDVQVSRTAIEADGRRLAWSDVRNVVVEDGRLVVTPSTGKPMKVRLSRIPDVEILGKLIGVDPAKMDLAYA